MESLLLFTNVGYKVSMFMFVVMLIMMVAGDYLYLYRLCGEQPGAGVDFQYLVSVGGISGIVYYIKHCDKIPAAAAEIGI